MTAAQVPILVEPSIVPVEIQSPIGSKTYYVGTDIGLAASLGSGISLSGGPGTFTWTIQYLDDPQAQPTTITSAAAQFSPAALGDLALSLRYTDAAGRERGAASLELRVEAEPRGLSLEWPHGAVVNAGVPLVPKLLGVPADVPARFLRWTLNGASLPGIEGLTAPLASGVYTLAVEYTADASPQRAEQVFTVNAAPVLSLDSPAQGQQYATGTALVLSARVEDDQPFTGSILWFAQDAALGEGSPLVVSAPAPGQWRLKAQAADQYGASSSSEISFLVYEPVSGIAVTVNGGQPFYSIYDAGPPMEARISFSGGIEPLVQWTLRQGEANIVKTGVSVGFSVDELQPFSAGQAALSLLVTDPGLADEGRRELFRRDYPIELFKGSLVRLARPAPEDIFHVGEDIPLVLALDGFLNPTIRASLNGREMELAWARAEGSAQWLASIPGVMIAAEGAYDLVIGANENGKSGSVSYTLNVYRQRVGIFIDDAPATFDLRGQSLTIHAQTSGLEGVDNIRWLSDLSPGSIGSGTSLDLGQAGLSPGARSITVQARAGERVLASATCSIRVFGPMELIVGPIGAEEVLIFQKGGQASLEAEARDKDGSALGPEAITWTSHLDGLLGRGGVLNLGAIAGLSGGDHILTIQAMGADGESINAIRRIRVRIAANESGGADQDEGGSDGSGGTDSGGDKNLDEGEEIRERERANREPTNAERAMQAAVEAALSRAATAAALRRIENALNVIQMRLMQARSQNGSAALISRLTTLLTQVTAFRQGAQRGMQKVVDFARRAAEEAAKAVEWETRQVSARARSAADAAVRYAEQADEQAGLVEDAALRAQEAANLARTL